MNVLGILPQYVPHSRVGAWITTHEYLAGMAALGHQVTVVTVDVAYPTYTIDGVTVHPNGAEVPSPDLVVTHLGISVGASMLCSSFGVPVVRMVHGLHHSNAERLDQGRTDLAVFSSWALAGDTNWDGPSMIAHPPIRPENYRCRPGKHVTLSNLSHDKGGSLLGWISEAHPEVPFLGVLGWGYQVDRQGPNVEVIEPVEDMRTVYRRTRTLLMPSLVETYGRVGLEAACSGIPTIAHPSPGLIEALGTSARWVHRSDRQGWIDAVGELQDPEAWKEASTRARTVEIPDADTTVTEVCGVFETIVMVNA